MLLFFGSIFAFAETGRQYHGIQSYATTIITKTLSSAASNYELLKDTGIGGSNSYVIDSIIFSASTATWLYLNDSATNGDVGYGYYRAPTGGTVIDRDMTLKLETAAGLYISTGEAGEICVEYHLE